MMLRALILAVLLSFVSIPATDAKSKQGDSYGGTHGGGAQGSPGRLGGWLQSQGYPAWFTTKDFLAGNARGLPFRQFLIVRPKAKDK